MHRWLSLNSVGPAGRSIEIRPRLCQNIRMSDAFVINLLHYLDDDGGFTLPPGSARRFAQHQGAIVIAVTSRTAATPRDHCTEVRCRRRPDHKGCTGLIVASYQENNPQTIIWECPVCKDNGYISGWQETIWDRQRLF